MGDDDIRSKPIQQRTPPTSSAQSRRQISCTQESELPHRSAMASGYGMHGGVGRCFPFWQEVMACYVVNTSAEDDSGKKKCSLVLEDYYECLHHKKEHARALAMQAAYARSESTMPRAPGKYGTWACWARRKILRRSLGAAEQRPVLPMVRNSGDYDQVYITCWFAAQFEEIYFI